uniref:TIR domain-containing protein n=1 Tax=Phytophthora ramorum TaxID=164328 RepID=H3HBM4_PHYRM
MVANSTLIVVVYLVRELANHVVVPAILKHKDEGAGEDAEKHCHAHSLDFLDMYAYSLVANVLLCLPALNFKACRLYRRARRDYSTVSSTSSSSREPTAVVAPASTVADITKEQQRFEKTYLFTLCEIIVVLEIPFLIYTLVVIFVPSDSGSISEMFSACDRQLATGYFLMFLVVQAIAVFAYLLSGTQDGGASVPAGSSKTQVHYVKVALYSAAKRGDVEHVRSLLETAVSISGPDFAIEWYEPRVWTLSGLVLLARGQRNPLHVAVAFDQIEVVRELLANGHFDVQQLDKIELLRLDLAWLYRLMFRLLFFVVRRSSAGVVANASAGGGAVDKECTRLLLDAGGNPLALPGEASGLLLTAFEVARIAGNAAVARQMEKYVDALLESGADVNVRDAQGDPLLCICAAGACASIKRGAKTSAGKLDKLGDDHIQDDEFDDGGNEDGEVGVMLSGRRSLARGLDPRIFQLLLDHGVDLLATRTSNGDSALHVALRRRNQTAAVLFVRAGITGGSVWRQEIARGIQSSALVLAVLTKDYPQSQWCMKELAFAKMQNIPVVAIQCEDMEISEELQVYLWTRQVIDFRPAVKHNYANEDNEEGERPRMASNSSHTMEETDSREGESGFQSEDDTTNELTNMLGKRVANVSRHGSRRNDSEIYPEDENRAMCGNPPAPDNTIECEGADTSNVQINFPEGPLNVPLFRPLRRIDSLASSLAFTSATDSFVFIAHGDYHRSFCLQLQKSLLKQGIRCVVDQTVPEVQYAHLPHDPVNAEAQSGGFGADLGGTDHQVARLPVQTRQLAAKDAILACSAVLVVLSPLSANCDLLADQLAFAEDRGKLLMPILLSLHKVDLAKRYTFSRSMVHHFNASLGFEQSLEQLANYLRAQQQNEARQRRLQRRQQEDQGDLGSSLGAMASRPSSLAAYTDVVEVQSPFDEELLSTDPSLLLPTLPR